ncbi:MAG TPA: hypothetical protein VNI77_09845 [Nitrososphaera sp.]|nr:hypothetical protein [Nitrososphaera sp.]
MTGQTGRAWAEGSRQWIAGLLSQLQPCNPEKAAGDVAFTHFSRLLELRYSTDDHKTQPQERDALARKRCIGRASSSSPNDQIITIVVQPVVMVSAAISAHALVSA